MEEGKKGKGGRGRILTPERIEIILDARRRGETYQRCCILAGIGKTLLYKRKAEGGEFAEALKKADREYQDAYRDELLSKAKRSLTELVTGYDYNETKSEYKGKILTRKTTTKKHVPPSPTAIIFTLTNLDPENWKNMQQMNVEGSIKSESEAKVSLANVPDDLLAKVIDAIHGKDE